MVSISSSLSVLGSIGGFSLFIFLIIGLIALAYILGQKRAKELEQFAIRHGFSFSRTDDQNIPAMYSTFHFFCQGHSRKAFNICQGKWKDYTLCIFDYQYTTGSGKNSHTYYFSMMITEIPYVFKSLVIRPENVFDKIGAAVGFNDIDFESAEFSKKFYVTCEDKKFAYDIIHPRMMEYLLSCPKIHLETNFRTILFPRTNRVSTAELDLMMLQLDKFIQLLPDYLKKDIQLTGGNN